MLPKPARDSGMPDVFGIHQRDEGIYVEERSQRLNLGFQQILDCLHSYGLSAGLAGKSRNNARTNFDTGPGV